MSRRSSSSSRSSIVGAFIKAVSSGGTSSSSKTAKGVRSKVRYCVGDVVNFQLKRGCPKRGEIKFIGGVFSLGLEEKTTVHFGIECETTLAGGNDGRVPGLPGKPLFRCAPGSGVFASQSQIIGFHRASENEERITVNTVIKYGKKSFGMVRFVGSMGELEGDWFGVELFEKMGNNNGTKDGHVYFECDPGFGILVRRREISVLKHKHLKDGSMMAGLERVKRMNGDGFSQLFTLDMEIDPLSSLVSRVSTSTDRSSVGTARSSLATDTDDRDASLLRMQRLRTIERERSGRASSKGSSLAGIREDSEEEKKCQPISPDVMVPGILESDFSHQAVIDQRERMLKTKLRKAALAAGMHDRSPIPTPISIDSHSQSHMLIRPVHSRHHRLFSDCFDCDDQKHILKHNSFSSVFKCYSKSLTIKGHRRKYALKKISKRKMAKMGDISASDLLSRVREEIRILRQMRKEKRKRLKGYRNVMHFVDAFEDRSYLYIVSNYCNGGNLYEYGLKDHCGLTEQECQKVMKDVLLGLNFLKNYHIAHLDLNPTNIMRVIHPETGEEIFQLIDLGMARVIPRMRKVTADVLGTPHFIAPEVLNGEYNPLSDVWSVGVILFLLLFGFPPFSNGNPLCTNDEIFQCIHRGFDTESWKLPKPGRGAWIQLDCPVPRSEAVCELVCRCLHSDLSQRITVDEALGHRWFETSEATDKELPTEMHKALLNFTKQCKFRVLISRLLATEMSSEDRKKVRTIFKSLDADGDGIVSREEFMLGMKEFELGYDEMSLMEMFDAVDINEDGCLNLSELMTAMSYQRVSAVDARLDAAFKQFDPDDTGHLTHEVLEKKHDDLASKLSLLSKTSTMDSRISKMGSDGSEYSISIRKPDTMEDLGIKKKKAESKSLLLRMEVGLAIESADGDGDGKINNDEFMQSMQPGLHESSTIPPKERVSPTHSGTFSEMRFVATMDGSGFEERDTLGAGDIDKHDTEYFDDEFDLGETSEEEE